MRALLDLGEGCVLVLRRAADLPALLDIGTRHKITGIEIINYRISGIWGPGEPHGPLFFAAPGLGHAAARGTEPDLSSPPRTRRTRSTCAT